MITGFERFRPSFVKGNLNNSAEGCIPIFFNKSRGKEKRIISGLNNFTKCTHNTIPSFNKLFFSAMESFDHVGSQGLQKSVCTALFAYFSLPFCLE